MSCVSRVFEKWAPTILGAIASLLWYCAQYKFPDSEALRASLLSVSGIFVAFLSTSKTILITLGDNPVMRDMVSSGYIDDLVSYIGNGIWANLAFCVINVLGWFVAVQSLWYPAVWIFFGVASFVSFYRITNIMLKIFKYSSNGGK